MSRCVDKRNLPLERQHGCLAAAERCRKRDYFELTRSESHALDRRDASRKY
jgi:hypothetical protein